MEIEVVCEDYHVRKRRERTNVSNKTGSNPVLTTKLKVMKNKKWFEGFVVGFLIGDIIGIIVLTLVQKGIL
jgi:hypothetical protein